MKRTGFYLVLALSLAVLPTMAMAELVTDVALDTFTDPVILNGETNGGYDTYATDIKAYGDQTASHSVGVMTVDSIDTTHSNFENFSFDGTVDVMKSNTCNGGPCSFEIVQGTFDISNEWGFSDVVTNIDVTSYTGSVDMSSYGGMAVCTTPTPGAYGDFSQFQRIDQVVNGPNGSSSSYTGTQSLDLSSYSP